MACACKHAKRVRRAEHANCVLARTRRTLSNLNDAIRCSRRLQAVNVDDRVNIDRRTAELLDAITNLDKNTEGARIIRGREAKIVDHARPERAVERFADPVCNRVEDAAIVVQLFSK